MSAFFVGMSAFFVGPGTVDAAISMLRIAGVERVPLSRFLKDSPLLHEGMCAWCPMSIPDRVGAELLELNRSAMLARYPHVAGTEGDDHMLDAIRSYRFQPSSDDPIVLVKSLDCWLYQCDEPERALWEVCNDVAEDWSPIELGRADSSRPPVDPLMAHLPFRARELARYEAAPWGIEREDVSRWMRGSLTSIVDVTPA